MQIIQSPTRMVKKISLILLGLLAVIQFSTAQVTVTLSDDSTDPDGTVDVDVTYDNFVDIIAFQHSITWDSLIFSFNSIQNVTTELDQFTIGAVGNPSNGGELGVVTVSWSKGNTEPESLPANTRMFTIRLNAIGDACDFSDIRLSNTPTVIEFSTNDVDNVGGIPDNGVISINGTGCNNGSDDLVITVDDVTANSGENVCVPITVENFIDMQVVGFGIEFDPTIIEYTGYQNANLGDFSSGNIGDTNTDEGKLSIAWFDNTVVTPVTLEGTLIELCFDALQAGTSPIDIVDAEGSEIDFTNSDEEAVPYTVVNGSFTVEGDINPDDFTLIAGDVDINMGGVGCVPISVRNFDDIQTMQFALEWDPSLLTYSAVQSINLDQLTNDNITLRDDDRIRVSWSNPSSASVPDGTVIFELCLEGIGDCDESSPIDFVSGPFFDIEVSNSSNEPIAVSRSSGSVTVVCDGCAIGGTLESPSCVGEADGSIQVSLPSGSFTCTWTDASGATIQSGSDCDISGLEAGTYTLSIDDGADCQESRTFELEDPGNIVFGGSKLNEETMCDGSISLEMIGGTAPFTFAWDDGTTSAERTMLCAGEYCVTATDVNGCTAETCFVIQANGPSPCTADVTDNRCFGEDEGAIDITICGGTGPYTIAWSGPSGEYTTEDISGLLAGDYDYTITDSSDPALVTMGSIEVGQSSEIMIASSSTPSDGNLNNGAIDITVTGGVGPYAYLWSPGGQQTEDVSGLSTGDYTVMVTDENNCTVTSNTIFVSSTSIVLMRTGEFDASCNGVCDGVIEGDVSGGSAPYTYRLNDTETSFPITGLCPAEYMLEIIDADGTSITQTIIVGDPEVLEVVLEDKMNCTSGNQDGFIEVEVSGGTGDYEYAWTVTGDGPRISGLNGDDYNVIVTDERGCTATLDTDVTVICDGTATCFTSRTIITPNGDGTNDELLIMCAPDFTNKLSVYDRWGNTVFSMDDYDNSWAGTRTNGDELPEGGYLWVIEITNGDGSREITTGSVTILRDQF